jgi:quercetin dioxygenase-like cupin family protein
MMIRAFLIGVTMLSLGGAAQSQVNPAGLKWGPAPPGLPRGAQLALLSGNPEKKGLFTIRLRFPAGYTVPPHHHPSDELVTVMSGQMSLGMGAKLNRARAKALVAGGYVVAPANMNHFAFTRTGATIQITTQGPFQIIYVNPADDPRRRR